MLQAWSNAHLSRIVAIGLSAIAILVGLLIFESSSKVAYGAGEKLVTIPSLQQWTQIGNPPFQFSPNSRIVVDSAYSAQLLQTGNVFADDLLSLTGYTIPVVSASGANPGDIFLTMGTTDAQLKFDGYLLNITDRITINGRTKGGTFYGTRTILQLLKQGHSIPRGSAKDWPVVEERALMVDNGRKYFTLSFLKNRVRELAYLKFNVLHLHFSDNEGFRIQSDTHPEITSSVHLTKTELAELIAFAAKYNITIVPEIDMPGHMRQLLAHHAELQLTDKNGMKHANNIDITLPGSKVFIQEILNEFIPLFPGPYWHIGADEYLYGTDYSMFPQLLTYAKANYGPNATAPDAYLGFVNWLNDFVKSKGKITRAWNDGLQNSSVVSVASDIQVEHWESSYLTPQQLIDRGHTILNANNSYLYYVLGTAWKPDSAAIYHDFTPSLFKGGTSVAVNDPKNRGASMKIWSDNPNSETESQIEFGIQNPLRAFSQKSWGSPRLVAEYASFLTIVNTIGSAPGYTGSLKYTKPGNIAAGKKVTVSSTETPAFQSQKANDGDFSTRWSSGQSNVEWIQIDLGATYQINQVILNWEAAYGKSFQIQVSPNASSWTTIYSTTNGAGGVQNIGNLSGSGRYIRMYATQKGLPPFGYSLYEFEVYGTSPNLALGKTAIASSVEATTAFTANLAVDGNSNTRWSSQYSNPQWIQIDLEAIYSINRVVLNWENAYGKAYQIQVSNDGSAWTTIYSTTTSTGGVQELTGLTGSGRYVRMWGIERVNEIWGYSLYEFQIFGNNLVQAAPAISSSVEGGTSFTPNLAADGNLATRWSSQPSDHEWIQFDLGAVRQINHVLLAWEAAYAKTYNIQVSDNGTNWRTVYGTADGSNGLQEIANISATGRYIRIQGVSRSLLPFGYSLYEVQVFGN